MKPAISNISLPPYDHTRELSAIRELGFLGIEIAPSRVWTQTENVRFSQIESYRQSVENAGLKVIGLHSLFFDQPDKGLFLGEEVRNKTMDYLVHLSSLCADLGGKTLVFGSPPARRRNGLSVDEADKLTISFFEALAERISSHGTCFVIEALGESESDYINSAAHALRITKSVNRKELRGHLDAKALTEADEVRPEIFECAAPFLEHYHANDPGLGVLGGSGEIDHFLLGNLLKNIGYKGFVSAEQRMISESDPIDSAKASYLVLKRHYLG